jgi:hypothetical protein
MPEGGKKERVPGDTFAATSWNGIQEEETLSQKLTGDDVARIPLTKESSQVSLAVNGVRLAGLQKVQEYNPPKKKTTRPGGRVARIVIVSVRRKRGCYTTLRTLPVRMQAAQT